MGGRLRSAWLKLAAQGLGALMLWALLSLGSWASAQDVLPVPALTARVIDQTGTLSAGDRSALEAKLAGFEAQAGPQMVFLLVPSTAPEDIAAYAQRVGETWKIGRRDVGDGLLVVVAVNDRRIWIAPAKALEERCRIWRRVRSSRPPFLQPSSATTMRVGCQGRRRSADGPNQG